MMDEEAREREKETERKERQREKIEDAKLLALKMWETATNHGKQADS